MPVISMINRDWTLLDQVFQGIILLPTVACCTSDVQMIRVPAVCLVCTANHEEGDFWEWPLILTGN